ncbi:MAG: APC family permease [Pirellulales bacterium]|nr:APC family permease [Pirellulales bacterium]
MTGWIRRDGKSEKRGLAGNSLGAFESAVMGIAGTAPAFSVAVTTATIVSAVGERSVGSIFYCGLIMFGIMLAFIHLNKITPNAGAAYAWVGHVFGNKWGFFAGWGLLVASIVFMVSATVPAAQATLVLIAESIHKPGLEENTTWVAITSAVWLTLVTIVVTKGIKHASYTQILLTGLETVVIFALILGAFYQYGGKPAHAPSWIWISPLSFTPQDFTSGALIALFFYWGWDVTMNLTEETKRGHPDPASKGAFWAMVNLILFFCIMMIVVLIVLSDEEIKNANTNILYVIANKLFPKPWSYLAVLSTLLSTVGTIETQLLQFSRSMFAMSRDKMLHPRYAKIHPEWQTPWVATFVIWFLGMLLLFSSSYMPSVKAILKCSVDAICFQICFYMSLAGFACAWHYRKELKNGAYNALSHVLWPLFAALFMVFIALYSIPTFDAITNIVGIGGILIGFVPLMLNTLWSDNGTDKN